MPMKAWLATIVLAAAAAACGDNNHLVSASPLIIPDVATVKVGSTQTFSVEGAAVERFDVRVDDGSWADCLSADSTAGSNVIRLVALKPCRGLAYVSADIGRGREPLVAVLTVE
jgi:hypothetical protein